MAINKEIIPFTYNENYQKICEKFIERGYDAPYEGSNTAILASILSYLVSGLNFNTAVNINENILTLATKRKNVIQDARVLSYEPSYKKSTILKITLEFTKIGNYIIPKYSNFTVNGFNYVYLNDDIDVEVDKVGKLVEIEIKEGYMIKFEDYPEILTYSIDERFEYVDLPWDDIEDDGIEVYVQYYDTYGNLLEAQQFFKSSSNLIDINDNFKNTFFRKDDLDTGNARIYFQLGTIGEKLPSNSKIYINILRTSGLNAYYEKFDSASINDNNLSKVCKIISFGPQMPMLISQAQNEESIESIKQNAPLFNNAANRVVTATDYSTMANRSTSIKNSKIWGGEDEYPVRPGNIFYSFEPKTKQSPIFIFNKIINDSGYLYSKNSEITDDTASTNSNYQYIFNILYNDTLLLYVTNETLSSSFNSLKRGSKGVLDIVNDLSLPALVDNIKNPVYINIDLSINVKQYPFGFTKSEIRKKLYNMLSKKIGEIEKFEGEYTQSNIVRYLDDVLGIGNGIEIKPFFSVFLSRKNAVKQIRENIDFNKINCFYAASYDEDGKYLIVNVNFSFLSKVNDVIIITFNKTELSFLPEYSNDVYEYALTEDDIRTSNKTFYFKDESFNISNLGIVYQSYDGLIKKTGTDINLFDLTNKTIYYYVNDGLQISVIKIALPRFARKDDNIKIFGIYGEQNAEQLLNEFILSYNDIERGYILVDDIHKSEYAGIIKADSYKIVFTSNHTTTNNEVIGTKCLTYQQAFDQTKTQDNITAGIQTENLYFNYYKENNYIYIRIWLPEGCTANDTITIRYGDDINIVTLTDSMIAQKMFDTCIEDAKLKISSINYIANDSTANINILPTYIESQSELVDIANDSIAFTTRYLENIINFAPSTTLDKIPQIKQNGFITFYTNYLNKFDIRNLILNYDDENVTYSVDIPNDSPLRYEDPYIILDNYRNVKTFNFSLNVNILRGDTLYQNITVFCKNPDVSILSDDGPGGVYVYLDIPVEGIYDSRGQLIIENLPVFQLNEYAVDDKTINFEKLIDINEERKFIDINEFNDLISSQRISLKEYPINEDDVKTALPFYTTIADFIELDLRRVQYIKLPLIKQSDSGESICGTYTIFNSKIPYIRIKLLNSIFIDDTNPLEFVLGYPSNNIKLIRSSIFKLRSVVFDDKLDYQEIREHIRENLA